MPAVQEAPAGRAESSSGSVADEGSARTRLPAVVLAGLAALVAAVGGLALVTLAPDEPTTTAAASEPAAPESVASESVASESGGSESDGPATQAAEESIGSSAPSATAGGLSVSDSSDDVLAAVNDRDTVRWRGDRDHAAVAAAADEAAWAVFSDYTLSVRGRLPSEEVVDEVRRRVANVVGAGSVSADYEVVADAPVPVDPPLFVEEGIAFEPGSTEIRPGSKTILQLAVVLMARFPQTDITVVHHSYPVDGVLIDEATAAAEADAVIGFWTDAGVDPARLAVELVAYGDEAAASGDVDDEADGRWIEFVVRGLLRDAPPAEPDGS